MAAADGTDMGDFLRKLLYPLVLPCIVTGVWGYAWSRKYDDQMNLSGPINMPGVVSDASGAGRLAPLVELEFIDDTEDAHVTDGKGFGHFASVEEEPSDR
jgi:hypothetical protein